MRNHVSEFAGGTISFEDRDEIIGDFGDGEVRCADVVLTYNGRNYYYEFKSYQESSLRSSNFVDQFVKDLQRTNVTAIEQLRWRFDATKLSGKASVLKQIVVASLNQYTTTLDNDRIRSLFQVFGRKTQPTLEILDNEDLFNYLNSSDDWFNQIFKIQ